jgi:hypothetical protein
MGVNGQLKAQLVGEEFMENFRQSRLDGGLTENCRQSKLNRERAVAYRMLSKKEIPVNPSFTLATNLHSNTPIHR